MKYTLRDLLNMFNASYAFMIDDGKNSKMYTNRHWVERERPDILDVIVDHYEIYNNKRGKCIKIWLG